MTETPLLLDSASQHFLNKRARQRTRRTAAHQPPQEYRFTPKPMPQSLVKAVTTAHREPSQDIPLPTGRQAHAESVAKKVNQKYTSYTDYLDKKLDQKPPAVASMVNKLIDRIRSL